MLLENRAEVGIGFIRIRRYTGRLGATNCSLAYWLRGPGGRAMLRRRRRDDIVLLAAGPVQTGRSLACPGRGWRGWVQDMKNLPRSRMLRVSRGLSRYKLPITTDKIVL